MVRTRPAYREDKATQVAARLLQLRGGSMNQLKLSKLLYLVEREALTRLGAPVSFDSYSSLPHGPVLNAALDRINTREAYEGGYWDRYIMPNADFSVTLRNLKGVPNDQLSRVEEELVEEVFARHGHLNRWKLVEYTQTLPEWTDPKGSSIPISPDEILRHAGFSDEEIAEIEAEWAEETFARSLATSDTP